MFWGEAQMVIARWEYQPGVPSGLRPVAWGVGAVAAAVLRPRGALRAFEYLEPAAISAHRDDQRAVVLLGEYEQL